MSDEDEVLAATEEIQEETPEVENTGVSAASDDGDATTADTEGEATEDSEGDAEEKPKRPPRGVQKRIDKLTAKVREYERQMELMQQPQPQPLAAPDREQFDDYEEYLEAKATYAVEKRLSQAAMAQRQQQAEVQQRQSAQAFDAARDSTLEAGMNKYDDFEEVATSDDLQITPDMAEALLTAKNGADIWYHLGKNPAKAEKISSMPRAQQILELAEIGVTLRSAKKPSNAPKPTKGVSGRGGASTSPTDNISMKEWIERRNRQVHG